jgi:putative sterol carrier protein
VTASKSTTSLAAQTGMMPLIAWGARHLGSRHSTEVFRPRWAAVAMAGMADRDATEGLRETYEFVIGQTIFHLEVDGGVVRAADGRAADPVVVVKSDEDAWADVWADIAAGELSFAAALSSGKLSVEGDRHAAKRMGRIFSRARPSAQAPALAEA